MQDRNLIYFVPLNQLRQYKDCAVVARGVDAREMIRALSNVPAESIAYVQLLDPEVDFTPLSTWAEGLALEVNLDRPLEQVGALYSLTPLLDRHPLRACIPVVPGNRNSSMTWWPTPRPTCPTNAAAYWPDRTAKS